MGVHPKVTQERLGHSLTRVTVDTLFAPHARDAAASGRDAGRPNRYAQRRSAIRTIKKKPRGYGVLLEPTSGFEPLTC